MLLSSGLTCLQQLFCVGTLLQVMVLSCTSSLTAGKLSNSKSNITSNNIIYFLSLLPHSLFNTGNCDPLQPARDGGASVLPAAELAIQHINEDPNTLIGYKVKLINADDSCNVTSKAFISFIEHVFHGTKGSGSV